MKEDYRARQIYEDDKVRAIEEAWSDLDAEAGKKGAPNVDDLARHNPTVAQEPGGIAAVKGKAVFEKIGVKP